MWRSSMERPLLTLAIDIGSANTGQAFSFITNPSHINTLSFCGSRGISLKAPTVVLLEASQEFVAFGYEAEDKYSEIVAYGDHKDYHYFHRFRELLPSKVCIII